VVISLSLSRCSLSLCGPRFAFLVVTLRRLKAELENLDPIGNSIQVTGKEVYEDNRVGTWSGTEEQG